MAKKGMDRSPGSASSKGAKFKLRDNEQAWTVRDVKTSVQEDSAKKVQNLMSGNKGYPAEAWNYQY